MTTEQLTSEQLFELHAAHIASNERLFAAIEVLNKDLPDRIGTIIRSAPTAPRVEIPEIPPFPDARPAVNRTTLIVVGMGLLNLAAVIVLYATQ